MVAVRIADGPVAVVRRARRPDLKAVLLLEASAFGNARELMHLLRSDEDLSTWVAVADGLTVGHTVLRPHGTGGCRLVSLVVHPRYQRMGIGAALLSQALAVGGLPLETLIHERNLGAQLFLKSTGFRAVGTVKNVHPDGSGAYLMVKQ